MADIILLTTNSKQENYSITANKFAALPPNIPLLITEAFLSSKGYEVKIIDTETYPKKNKDVIIEINESKAKVVGVVCSGSNPSASTMSMVGAIKFFQDLNKTEHNFLTFVCGGHPTVLPERTLRELGSDFVVLGEGYQAMCDIIEYSKKKNKKK